MSASLSRIYSSQPVSEEAERTLVVFSEEIASAISKAKEAGILQGFLVSILAGHFIQETNTLNSTAAE
ncbi:hypothetical protein [Metapseudomonas otitidis]|uniref:hypothetical protein n=1 Tax=Metapseudomonas otitidis TaxID=319939 RepID=UPI00367268A7